MDYDDMKKGVIITSNNMDWKYCLAARDKMGVIEEVSFKDHTKRKYALNMVYLVREREHCYGILYYNFCDEIVPQDRVKIEFKDETLNLK